MLELLRHSAMEPQEGILNFEFYITVTVVDFFVDSRLWNERRAFIGKSDRTGGIG